MITLITGAPGSGKTLYTVSELLRPLIGQTVEAEVDGEKVTYPRTIYTNINGLQLDHELIDGGENQGLRDWHKWAKPGAVICFDEVQRVWEPRPNGAKKPEDIAMLETHRHLGVDFIVMTQGPMLVDRNLLSLAGRHLHVRRVGNMPLAVIYEWDHASRTLMFSKAFAKHFFRYSKQVYKLYVSAKAHTKQPRKIPTVVFGIIAALVGTFTLWPMLYARINDRISPQSQQVSVSVAPAPARPASVGQWAVVATAAPSPMSTASAPLLGASAPAEAPSRPVFAGCAVTFKGICKCFSTAGESMEVKPEMCLDDLPPKTGAELSSMALFAKADPPIDKARQAQHLDGLAFVRAREEDAVRYGLRTPAEAVGRFAR